MASPLTIRWEHEIDLGGSKRRFTSPADPNFLSLSGIDDDVFVVAAGATITVWDASTSPLITFDFLYLDAEGGDFDLEFTCTSASGTRTFCMALAAAELPFTLSSQRSIFGFSDTNIGVISKVRARALLTNTSDARLRFGVGQA